LNKDVEQFNTVLIQFKFKNPVQPSVRTYILENKSRQFKLILKKAGGYSILFALISHAYFFLQKFGISATIAKTLVITGLTSVAATTIVVSGFFCFPELKAPLKDKSEITNSQSGSLKQSEIITKSNSDKKKPVHPEKIISIGEFIPFNLSIPHGEKIRLLLYDELSHLLDRDIIIEKQKSEKASIILKGSVGMINNKYTVTAKIIKPKTSQIIFYFSETTDSKKSLNKICVKIAREISQKLKEIKL